MDQTFQLTTITQVLADGTELAEALGFPEISALADTESHWRAALQVKAKALLEDSTLTPVLSLHRRRSVATPELAEVELEIKPPQRSPDWQESVTLRLAVVRWTENPDSHQAYIPALGIQVFAPSAALLQKRIVEHSRLVLTGRRRKLTLLDLAKLERIQALKLGQLALKAKIAAPKQTAEALGIEPEGPSMLETLAEELPPCLSQRTPESSDESSARPKPEPAPPSAFEMEAELKSLAETLAGADRRSLLLVGPAGCGKTALVRELARRRAEFGFGSTPFWSTTGARLMTGPIGFGMWQERCQKLCREAAKTHAILHVGHLSELLEVGKARRGQQSVGSFLRPWMARGELLAIAECTPEQLGLLERNEPHLLGVFLQVQVRERTTRQTRAILDRVLETAPGKTKAEDAPATQAALDRLHQLHQRYALYSANPGRPIRFLRQLLAEKFPERKLSPAEVTAAFSRETGLPLVLLDDQVPLDLEEAQAWFAGRIFGQPEAIARVTDLLAVIKARLARPAKPLASFLFIGPTGTGKTELAKALAEFLFGDAARLARFDLNQYNDPASIQRLLGGPLAGTAEGLLTARIREQPFSVLLLDEFEKADPSFFDLLLQILGDGRLTDAAGRVADFSNSVIVMTSNLGVQGFQRGPSGFRASDRLTPDAREHFTEAVRKFLRPEIFNRLDAVLPFQPLPPDIIRSIAQRHLELLRQRDGLRLRELELRLDPAVLEYIAQKGYDARYGVRPLKRVLERELLAPLAKSLTEYVPPGSLRVDIKVGAQGIHIKLQATESSEARRSLPQVVHADRFVAHRRQIGWLKNCSAVNEIENQAAMTETLARQLAAASWKSPEQQARLARLPRLQACLQEVAALYARAEKLETEALALCFQRQTMEERLFAPALQELEAATRLVTREVFRLQLQNPDDIVIGLYSEHHTWLLQLAAAYYQLGKQNGQLLGLDFVVPPPTGRSKGAQAIRQPTKRLDQPFLSPPEKLVGIIMHLRGDLYAPLFAGEAGLHALKRKHVEEFCLIETSSAGFAKYQPPEAIARQGSIKSKGAAARRKFDIEAEEVHDSGSSPRPWKGAAVEECLSIYLEERLERAIAAMIRA